ncbi:MAG: sugar phosphate nucleotidyltransferase [bacterium]
MQLTNPQVVLLCAGKSSRFYPFTDSFHKSMIRIAGKPILEHTLDQLVSCGLKDIIIVLGPKEAGSQEIVAHCGQGQKWGISIRYVYEKEQLGMGKAVQTTAPLLTRPFFVLNPNHINAAQFIPELFSKFSTNSRGVLLIRETHTPQNYGVVLLDQDKVVSVIEKPSPESPPSNKKIIGIYLLNPTFLNTLQKVPVAQDQFETALDIFTKEQPLTAVTTDKPTFSLKYPWHLFTIKQHILQNSKEKMGQQVTIHPTAILEGHIIMEEQVKIGEYAIIKGPAYIGKNVHIGSHTLVRNYTSLESDSSIGCYTEIKNTLLGVKSTLHSGFIGDSLIGENTHIGADFISANKRLDRTAINTMVKGEKINTHLTALGTMIGNNCKIGIRVSTMPGITIGPQKAIGPGEIIRKNF